jgi:hypothetical protein
LEVESPSSRKRKGLYHRAGKEQSKDLTICGNVPGQYRHRSLVGGLSAGCVRLGRDLSDRNTWLSRGSHPDEGAQADPICREGARRRPANLRPQQPAWRTEATQWRIEAAAAQAASEKHSWSRSQRLDVPTARARQRAVISSKHCLVTAAWGGIGVVAGARDGLYCSPAMLLEPQLVRYVCPY